MAETGQGDEEEEHDDDDEGRFSDLKFGEWDAGKAPRRAICPLKDPTSKKSMLPFMEHTREILNFSREAKEISWSGVPVPRMVAGDPVDISHFQDLILSNLTPMDKSV